MNENSVHPKLFDSEHNNVRCQEGRPKRRILQVGKYCGRRESRACDIAQERVYHRTDKSTREALVLQRRV
jgi:hypothetical protein